MKIINGITLSNMIQSGGENLQKNTERINALNVFPVPDGDTGTNMNLTFTAGINEIRKEKSESIHVVTQALAKGLLMGARGNSGVILSQLFRGFSFYSKEKETLSIKEFSEAFQKGVETAYKSVIKPVEGTILTVARETATHALEIAHLHDDFSIFMEEVVKASKESLRKTPELLPVLKEVGVVDSGGQGLVCVFEGFLASLKGENLPEADNIYRIENKEEHVKDEVALLMQEGILSEEDIVFGYCTEFIIRLNKKEFNEHLFREKMSMLGDSLLVIADDELVKIHIHAENLSKVFSVSQYYGELIHIKIENMREQFRNRASVEGKPKKESGVVAVVMGKGFEKIYKTLGVDVVIEGGQTMNPSTEDLIRAIKKTNADNVFVLPNNSNIILAAQQASELSDANVIVLPTKSVQQGLSAMLGYNPDVGIDQSEKEMKKGMESVASAQITKAVRDTTFEGVEVKEGHYIGITEGKLCVSTEELKHALMETLENTIKSSHEIVTLYYGEDLSEEEARQLMAHAEETYEELEFELHEGGQPLYPFIIGME